MKGKFSLMWRMTIALVLALSLGGIMAVPVSASVTSATVGVVPTSAGEAAEYTITFNVGGTGALAVDDTIVIVFHAGTVVDEGVGAITGTVNDVAIVTAAGDTGARTATINTPVIVANDGEVVVVLATGITNPEAAGDCTLTVATSIEADPIASQTYTITAGALAKYLVEPEAVTYTAGTAFNVVITAVDQFDNPLGAVYATDAPYNWVTNAANAPNGTPPVIGTLTGGEFSNGVATKSVTLYAAEVGVTFAVTDTSSITGTSDPLDVVSAAVNTLTVEVEPSTAVAGVAIAPPVQVKAVDEFTNVIDGQGITASLLAGTGTLSGTLTKTTDASGIATFDDLSINLTGADKQLRFTANGVTVDSAVFEITIAAVNTLTVEVEPSAAVAGVAIAPPVQVKAVDEFTNVIAGQGITASLLAGTGTLSGTLTKTTDASGIATFDDLSIELTGADKQLRFTANGVTVDSAVFEITSGELVSFVFDAIDPQDTGVAFSITITAADEYGNAVTGYTATAALTVLTGAISPITTTAGFTAGVWTDNVTITLRGANTITATDGEITGDSGTFNVYDTLLTLNVDDWTLVSTDDFIIYSGDNTSGFEGSVVSNLIYRYTDSGFLTATVEHLKPVEAIYVKTTGIDDGWLGLNYDTDATPGASIKSLVEGWNLIGIAGQTNARTTLIQLRCATVGQQEGAGLAAIVSQGDYNVSGNAGFYIPTLDTGDWTVTTGPLDTKVLDEFDGYWVYMNIAKSFGVFPGA